MKRKDSRKGRKQVVNKYMNVFNFTSHQTNANQTASRIHAIPVLTGVRESLRIQTINVGAEVDKRKFLYTTDGNIN